MPDKGSIAEKPVAELFREMAVQGRGGVLRLANGKQIKVIVFEEGRPVFAISNVPEDQLDVLLVRQRLLTAEQARTVKSQIQKEPEFGKKVAELGLLDKDAVESAMLDQVSRIIYSVASWVEGEYLLDTSARVPHEVTLTTPVTQFLLDAGSRVPPETARMLLGPPGTQYGPASGISHDALSLAPMDGFLLTRITRPMTVDAICAESGIAEDQVLSSLYGLYAAGIVVKGAGAAQPAPAPVRPAAPAQPAPAADEDELSIEDLHVELDRVLARMKVSEHYEVLNLDRQATPADVKKAYYGLAKRYHPDRYHHASDPVIREKLETVFGHVSRAYDVLKDERLRGDYDRRIGPPKAPPPVTAPPPPPVATPRPVSTPQSQPAAARHSPSPAPQASRSHDASAAPSRPTTAPLPPPAPAQAAPPPVASQRAPAEPNDVGTNEKLAEQNYKEGLKRFENKDLMGAIPLLREAIRLNPGNGNYHFHLGTALCVNPRWYKEAEKHLLEAARTEPFNVQVFLKLGHLYQNSGLAKRAESQYRAALSLDPSNRTARDALQEMGLDVPALKSASGKDADKGGGGFFSKFFKKK